MKQGDFMPIEKYYSLKAVFERVWGKGTYLELKHCSSLSVWKKYSERTLLASKQSIEETVLICDDDWKNDAYDIIEFGISRIQKAENFDDLFCILSSSYIELSFHQIGHAPSHSLSHRAQLRKGNWNRNAYRTVQYVQNFEQMQAIENKKERLEKANKNRKNEAK